MLCAPGDTWKLCARSGRRDRCATHLSRRQAWPFARRSLVPGQASRIRAGPKPNRAILDYSPSARLAKEGALEADERYWVDSLVRFSPARPALAWLASVHHIRPVEYQQC